MHVLPLATVIIPSYNSPDIFSTLRSVISQDYPRIQLILVDDASDDFPEQDVKTYLHTHSKKNVEEFQILINEHNIGTVRTMNKALQLSCGDYIFNLASDDCFYDEQVLSDWVAEFQKTGAQVITAYRAVYDNQMEHQSQIEPTEKQVRRIKTLSPRDLFEDIAQTNYIFGCCTARTAACVQKYGFYDERYRLVEDHPMNLKLLRSGERIHFFERIVVKYREGGTSSPGRYNAVYAQDVDNILQYDVLPYTDRPMRMKWFHYQWKRDQQLLRRRAKDLTQYREYRFACCLIQIRYYLHHPIRTLCRLPHYINKKIKKEKSHGGTD